jgi:hypothetical protein
MNSEESLQLIHRMINESKQSYHRSGPYFLAWGVLLAIAGLVEFILVYQLDTKHGYLVWPAIAVLGGVFSFVYSKKEDQKQKNTQTFSDIAQQFVWGAFGVSLVLIIVCSVLQRINPTPYVLLLTAVPTFITGGLVKFRPLLIGAVVFWITGVASFFTPVQYTSLLFCVAILLGYVLPGYLLYKSENLKS